MAYFKLDHNASSIISLIQERVEFLKETDKILDFILSKIVQTDKTSLNIVVLEAFDNISRLDNNTIEYLTPSLGGIKSSKFSELLIKFGKVFSNIKDFIARNENSDTERLRALDMLKW